MKRKSKDDDSGDDVDQDEEEEELEWGSDDDQDYGDVIGGEASTSTRPQRSAQSKGKGKEREVVEKKSKKGKGFSWEGGYDRTWDMVVEDDDGSLESTVNELLLSNRIKRVLLDTSSIQRGIIRHVYLVIDLSLAMNLREFKKSWLDLTIQYTKEFVTEFFDQNPISQLAIIGTREGTAERISPLSGNPVEHLKALSTKKKLETRGEPSLQNVLEMARSGLSHLPPHGSREVIVILGSLTTCDPGNVHTTIEATDKDRIRVNIIGLSAEMKICKDICTETKGTYSVAKDDISLRELLFTYISPPPTLSATPNTTATTPATPLTPAVPSNTSDLLQMGFPLLRHSQNYPAFCACHGKLKTVGYICPRCESWNCELPSQCKVCDLSLVGSFNLARSWRWLFPTANFDKVPIPKTRSVELSLLQPACEACAFPFPSIASLGTVPSSKSAEAAKSTISASGRYRCTECEKDFCLDCDHLIHTALGLCPSCV